jgi:hypothetical protein
MGGCRGPERRQPHAIRIHLESQGMSDLKRSLGGSPGTVIVRLLFLSLLVGAFLAFLDITPIELIRNAYYWLRSVIDLSLDSVIEIGRWMLYGAMIVVPLWLLSFLFNRR